jgi:antitoxin MazE
MEAVIRKWGNSPAVRLPASAIKEAAFRLEQKVNLTVTRGRIVIEPSGKIEYDLETLVGGITAKNLHTEFGFGRAVGKEAL